MSRRVLFLVKESGGYPVFPFLFLVSGFGSQYRVTLELSQFGNFTISKEDVSELSMQNPFQRRRRVALMNGGLRGNRNISPVKNVDQMDLRRDIVIPRDFSSRNRDNDPPLDDEVNIAAEESLSDYCKPVELYNIIQKRLARQPLFLQRCLAYKIAAARQRSMKMTVTATGLANSRGPIWGTTVKAVGKEFGLNDLVSGRQAYSVIVMVTSPVNDLTKEGQFAYRVRRTKVLIFGHSPNPDLDSSQSRVTFILPETRKLLLNAKRGDVVLFIVVAQEGRQVEASEGYLDLANCSGRVTWGKVAFTSICQMWLKSTREYSRMRTEGRDPLDPREHGYVTTTHVDLKHGKLQHDSSDIEPSILLTTSTKVANERSLVRVQVRITGEEVGHPSLVNENAKHVNGTLPRSPLPYTRSKGRIGRIVFHYLYAQGTRRKTEVTEEFSCPFCLSRCASFKGLEFHLNATHDLFTFEYLVSGELQVVIVNIRSDVPLGPSGVLRSLDLDGPRSKEFIYWYARSRSRKRRVPKRSNAQMSGETGQLVQLPDVEKIKRVVNEGEDANSEDLHSADDTSWVPEEMDTSLEITDHQVNVEQQLQVGVTLELTGDDELSNGSNGLNSTGSDRTTDGHQRKDGIHVYTTSSQLLDPNRAGKLLDADCLAHIAKQRSVSAQKRQRMKGVLGERAQARARPNSAQGGAMCAAAAGAPLEDCALQSNAQVPPKAPVDRPDLSRSHSSLQKRQYFHSHTAQPMDSEQLFGDRDSEDEVDAVIADLEDRRMLDDFVDVTGEEKEVMHLWNSFVRRNRVLADGHCPWACKEFTKENAQRFGANPALRRCLMLFLVKLWNHHLVDSATITSCLSIADSFDTQENVSPKQ